MEPDILGNLPTPRPSYLIETTKSSTSYVCTKMSIFQTFKI